MIQTEKTHYYKNANSPTFNVWFLTKIPVLLFIEPKKLILMLLLKKKCTRFCPAIWGGGGKNEEKHCISDIKIDYAVTENSKN